MRQKGLRRAAALVLALALAAPTAWAAPGGPGWGGLVGVWGTLWHWVGAVWAKTGPSIDPEGKPAPPPAARTVGDWTKEGPHIDPEGQPHAAPGACTAGDCTGQGPDSSPEG